MYIKKGYKNIVRHNSIKTRGLPGENEKFNQVSSIFKGVSDT